MNNNLKQFRKEANLTLKGLGDMCFLSKSPIFELEKDNPRSPKLIIAYAISKVLDKTVYEIWPDETEIIEETITIRRVKQNNETKWNIYIKSHM